MPRWAHCGGNSGKKTKPGIISGKHWSGRVPTWNAIFWRAGCFFKEESGRFLWVKRGESARCRNGDLSYLYKRRQGGQGYCLRQSFLFFLEQAIRLKMMPRNLRRLVKPRSNHRLLAALTDFISAYPEMILI